MRAIIFLGYLGFILFILFQIFGLLVIPNTVQASEKPAEGQYNIWPLHNPWASEKIVIEPPGPFVVPRFDNNDVPIQTPISPIQLAPRVDPEGIFHAVLNCYPERSKFDIELELQARYQARTIYDASNTDIGRHYFALVARMPIYSVTDLNREREREYMRRTLTAQTIGAFMAALAARNHAHRELGLYGALEARSQIRVAQGVANTSEQVGYLEKVAAAQQALILAESQLVQYRLTLVAQCGKGNTLAVNNYLKRLVALNWPDTPP